MTGARPRDEDELFAEIDRNARDEAERNGSKAIYAALKQHAPAIGGESALPADDRQLSERILAQARSRSAELHLARRAASARLPVQGAPIPWWLILAWILAIVGLVVAWRWWR